MTIGNARIVGDQVKCWHCPCTLGAVDASENGVVLFAAQPVYRRAAGDAIPGTSVLIIARHQRDRLRLTGMPMTGKPTLDKDWKVRVASPTRVAMPVLLPCWRPGCGEPNRVDTTMAQVSQ